MKRLYIVFLLFCIIGGLLLYADSFAYEWYSVPRNEVFEVAQRLADKPREIRWREWYEETDKLATPRKALHDSGIGLLTFGAVLAVLYLVFGFPLNSARTPRKMWVAFVLYIAAVAVQVPAAIYVFGHRFGRLEYPPWGDSIIIGIASVTIASVLFGGVGLVVFIIGFASSKLPANLYIWNSQRPGVSSAVSILFAVPVILIVLSLPGAVLDGSVGGCILMPVLIYLFMSSRAGIINGQIARQQEEEDKTPPPLSDNVVENQKITATGT